MLALMDILESRACTNSDGGARRHANAQTGSRSLSPRRFAKARIAVAKLRSSPRSRIKSVAASSATGCRRKSRNTRAKFARALLADDHAEIRAQIGNVLASEFEIVGSVANGLDLIKATAKLDPDVVVLDITMPGLDGIEAARRLTRSGCRAKLVFLTVHNDPDYVRAALQSGGAAYVLKERLASDLITAPFTKLSRDSASSRRHERRQPNPMAS